MGPDLVVSLPARPEPFELRCRASALVIVDMQNAYCSPEGYLDLAGFDISAARPVIEAVKATIGAARAVGMPVVYLQNGWDPDYREAGGPAAGAVGAAPGQGLVGLRARRRAEARPRRVRGPEGPVQRLLGHESRPVPPRERGSHARLRRGGERFFGWVTTVAELRAALQATGHPDR